MMLVAFPSEAPGGLKARLSEHFGHCEAFTLVELDGEQVGTVQVIRNDVHEQGGCMAPVMLLKQRGVQALVAGGMGMRPLAGFQEVGITVYFNEGASTVEEAARLMAAGGCREFGKEQTCGGGQGGCGGHDHDHHHHAPIHREVVDGPVAQDRVVFLDFSVTDETGARLESAEGLGYLHGHEQMVPGLERCLEGRKAGDSFEVTVTPEDGYGPRDPARQLTVPRDRLPPQVKVGDTLHAESPHGGSIPLKVLILEDTQATLDANHPLAGRTLTFTGKVVSVQAAAPEDLQGCGHEH